ncbi:hypothetical protein T484DRAFT_3629162 [Baffinella frigidus]|nr:hypothetical protein T484DRAFT_3629162 [Cryptophyta sp. CCMP2293]
MVGSDCCLHPPFASPNLDNGKRPVERRSWWFVRACERAVQRVVEVVASILEKAATEVPRNRQKSNTSEGDTSEGDTSEGDTSEDETSKNDTSDTGESESSNDTGESESSLEREGEEEWGWSGRPTPRNAREGEISLEQEGKREWRRRGCPGERKEFLKSFENRRREEEAKRDWHPPGRWVPVRVPVRERNRAWEGEQEHYDRVHTEWHSVSLAVEREREQALERKREWEREQRWDREEPRRATKSRKHKKSRIDYEIDPRSGLDTEGGD